MFYLFILESIGTSELILIGLVALIVFGPRKLPELAKTLGKAMNEFRRSTDEFKKTWQQEVDFDGEEDKNEPKLISSLENQTISNNSINKDAAPTKDELIAPEIRELSQADIQNSFSERETSAQTPVISEVKATNKQDWL